MQLERHVRPRRVFPTLVRLVASCCIAALAALTAGAPEANALTCGNTYTVKEGDTLNAISQEAYGIPSKWSLIFYANQKQFSNSTLLVPGKKLKIPCLKASAPEPAVESTGKSQKAAKTDKIEVSRIKAQIQLLTADDYRPFTDRSLPDGGMITDIINSAMTVLRQKTDGPTFQISWVNDWSTHLNPLLVKKAFDMGFPWFQPNCEEYASLDEPARFRCDRLFFSRPVFEILVLFFVRKDSGFTFNSDNDVLGKRICRPAGYFTFDLDKGGRNWVKEKKINMVHPQSVDECFQLLKRGEVDAVALNEFTGRAAVRKLQFSKEITTIERPISLLGLHVVVAKTHPRARTFLYYINSALDRIRETGEYDKIVDKHLSRFWGNQSSG